MNDRRVKKRIYIITVIAAFFLGVLVAGFYLYSKNEAQLPKNDSYFSNKYKDAKDHDACIAEFNEKGQTEGRLIGIPCPGEPQ